MGEYLLVSHKHLALFRTPAGDTSCTPYACIVFSTVSLLQLPTGVRSREGETSLSLLIIVPNKSLLNINCNDLS